MKLYKIVIVMFISFMLDICFVNASTSLTVSCVESKVKPNTNTTCNLYLHISDYTLSGIEFNYEITNGSFVSFTEGSGFSKASSGETIEDGFSLLSNNISHNTLLGSFVIKSGSVGNVTLNISNITLSNQDHITSTLDDTSGSIKIMSKINSLSSISLSTSSLNEEFNSDLLNYTVNVESDVKSITITPTKADSLSEFVTNYSGGTYDLQIGDNTILIKVLSESGDLKTYSIVVTKNDYFNFVLRPSNLLLKYNTYNSIDLSFNSVPNATNYEIYRSAVSSKEYVKVADITSLTYTDTNLITGKTYYYKVRAYRVVDEEKIYTEFTSYKSVVPRVNAPVLSVILEGYNSVKLSWKAVPGASGYLIYRSASEKGIYSLIKSVDKNTLIYTNTKLKTGTRYYYKIRAYRVVSKVKKYGSYSNIVSGRPYLRSSELTGYNDYYRYARVSWNKITGSSGYRVYRSNEENGTYSYIGKTTNLYYSDYTAKENIPYFYRVKSYRVVNNRNIYSSFSNTTTATRKIDSIVFNLTNNAYNNTIVTINPLSDALKYYIYRSSSKTGTYSLIKTLNASDFENNITYVDSKLKFNKTYYYKVRILNKNYSDYSSYKSFKTTLITPVLSINSIDDKCNITINEVLGSSGYAIYKSMDNKDYSLLKRTTSLILEDTFNSTENKLYYKARSYKVVSGKRIYSPLSVSYECIKSN